MGDFFLRGEITSQGINLSLPLLLSLCLCLSLCLSRRNRERKALGLLLCDSAADTSYCEEWALFCWAPTKNTAGLLSVETWHIAPPTKDAEYWLTMPTGDLCAPLFSWSPCDIVTMCPNCTGFGQREPFPNGFSIPFWKPPMILWAVVHFYHEVPFAHPVSIPGMRHVSTEIWFRPVEGGLWTQTWELCVSYSSTGRWKWPWLLHPPLLTPAASSI